MRLEPQLGVEELRTPEQVVPRRRRGSRNPDDRRQLGLRMRGRQSTPGVALALRHSARPDRIATVFAGADVEATDRARQYFTGYAPSSPSIAILRDGKLVYMLERRNIENRDAFSIADELSKAFDKFCAPAPTT